MRQKVVILMSDTGGGHRTSAEAIHEGLVYEYGDTLAVELIDGLRDYAPYPFSRFPAWYPSMSSARAWEPGYHLIDGRRRIRALNRAVWPYVRNGMRRMLRENLCDVIVNVHAIFIGPVLRALGAERPRVVNVVTDLVTTHALWFHPQADLTLVPTAAARERALACKVPTDRVKVTGLPVSQKFHDCISDRQTLRSALEWLPDILTVLLIGGGAGMGPLEKIARRLAESRLPIQLAVVCGRNDALRKSLESEDWPLPVHVYGYMENMPELMTAADLVVTKAGPSSVMEALHCGRPLILSGAIPGQEDGNIRFVVENECGVWAPGAERVLEAVTQLVKEGPSELARMSTNARHLAQPDAARVIAREIGRFVPQLAVS